MKKLLLLLLLLSVATNAQSIVSIIAGGGSSLGDGGPATNGQVSGTQGICYDGAGNLYISDVGHSRIRKIDPAGIITTVAGNGAAGFLGDGGPATAAKINAYGLGCDYAGDLYIGDWNNNRVRRVDAATGIITTVAGNGTGGSTGDGGPATAAEINRPINACVDLANNIYICEYSGGKIRKVDGTTGIITTVATGVGSPCQVVVDGANNLYIVDQGGKIYKANPAGVVTTYAGGGSGTSSGIAATATSLAGPEGVTMDCNGNIYIADNDNNLIRKVDATTGIITNIAGGGTTTVTYTGVPALSAKFHNEMICFDNMGNLFCTDDQANYCYKISDVYTSGAITGSVVTLCPGAMITLSDANLGGVWFSSNTTVATISGAGVVSGVSFGVANISYVVSSFLSDITITIGTIPPITGTDTLCTGTLIQLSSAIDGGTWSSSNTTIATIDSITGLVIGVNAGTSVITCANICGVSTTSITVLPSSGASVITCPPGVCVGATTSLSDTVSGGVWNISNGNAALSGDNVTGVSPGMDTISYTVTSASCGTATVTAVITIATPPNAGSISGDTTVCAGDTITLYDTASGGVWSSNNNGLATVSGAGVVSAALSAGRDTISYVVTNACSPDSATYTITVDPLPPISPIAGPDSACPNVTFMLNDATTPGVWSANNPTGLSIDSAGLVSTFAAGSAIITYTTGPLGSTETGGCYSTATYTVTITYQGNFTVDSTITAVSCYGGSNGSIRLTTSGTQNYSYLWYNVVSSDSFLTGQPSGYDTVSIKAETTQCLEVLTFYIPQPDSLQLTTFPKNDTCGEGKGSISVAVTGGTGGYAYLWPDKKTGKDNTGLIAGTYSVVVTDSAGCTKSTAATVGEDTTCNSIVIYNVLTPNGDGINDTWVIEGLAAYPNNTVQLFDKWGDLVYEKTNYNNDFNGKGKSGDLPDGTYYYLVKLNAANLQGGGNVWTGYLMVKR